MPAPRMSTGCMQAPRERAYSLQRPCSLLAGRRIRLQIAHRELDAVEVEPQHGRVPVDFLAMAERAIEDSALAVVVAPGDGKVLVLAVNAELVVDRGLKLV